MALPREAALVAEAQLQYNAMTTSPIELLIAERQQIGSGLAWIHALPGYRHAPADLEQLLDGRMPPSATMSAVMHDGERWIDVDMNRRGFTALHLGAAKPRRFVRTNNDNRPPIPRDVIPMKTDEDCRGKISVAGMANIVKVRKTLSDGNLNRNANPARYRSPTEKMALPIDAATAALDGIRI